MNEENVTSAMENIMEINKMTPVKKCKTVVEKDTHLMNKIGKTNITGYISTIRAVEHFAKIARFV
jgi:hypothetical protein